MVRVASIKVVLVGRALLRQQLNLEHVINRFLLHQVYIWCLISERMTLLLQVHQLLFFHLSSPLFLAPLRWSKKELLWFLFHSLRRLLFYIHGRFHVCATLPNCWYNDLSVCNTRNDLTSKWNGVSSAPMPSVVGPIIGAIAAAVAAAARTSLWSEVI